MRGTAVVVRRQGRHGRYDQGNDVLPGILPVQCIFQSRIRNPSGQGPALQLPEAEARQLGPQCLLSSRVRGLRSPNDLPSAPPAPSGLVVGYDQRNQVGPRCVAVHGLLHPPCGDPARHRLGVQGHQLQRLQLGRQLIGRPPGVTLCHAIDPVGHFFRNHARHGRLRAVAVEGHIQHVRRHALRHGALPQRHQPEAFQFIHASHSNGTARWRFPGTFEGDDQRDSRLSRVIAVVYAVDCLPVRTSLGGPLLQSRHLQSL